MEAQSYALHAFWWLAIFPGITAVAYYACCSGTRTKRIGVAAHSVALLSAFVFAIVVSPWSGHYSAVFLWSFRGILCLYLVGVGFAVAMFDGESAIHGLQIFQMLNAILIWAVGEMTITNDGP